MSDSPQEATAAFVEWLGQPVRRSGRLWYANCPLHASSKSERQRTASLVIYPDGAAKCRGACGTEGSWSGPYWMWLHLTYGPRSLGGYTPEERAAATRFFQQQNWPTSSGKTVKAREAMEPDEETKIAIGKLFAWAHEQYLHGDNRGKLYARHRGLSDYADPYLGYVPDDINSQLDLLNMLKRTCGTGPESVALKQATGFLGMGGNSRLKNRLLICFNDEEGLPQYYQGRWIPRGPRFSMAEADHESVRYLSSPGWSGMPTLLRGVSQTVHVVESPIDGLSLHQCGATVIITWGWGKIYQASTLLSHFAFQNIPIIVWRDPNEAGYRFTDALYDIIYPHPFSLQTADPYEDPSEWLQYDQASLTNLVLATV